MADHKCIRALICLSLCSIFYVSSAQDQECDKSKCPGPLAYYADLDCTPIYETENDCCAVKYNCDHLKQRSPNKCYINGKVYTVGEALKDEDAKPCDIGCFCTQGKSASGFVCAIVDCFQGPATPGCYRKNSPLSCCPGEEVCPENPEDRPQCQVDGKTYKDGEYFTVESDPDLNCVCQEGYKGENIEPFCKSYDYKCGIERLGAVEDVRRNCAPVYYSTQSLATSCSVTSRCQNAHDRVISENETTTSNSNDVCKFGSLTMKKGDELNQATDYSSVCVKCVCDVPPVPSCQRLPDEECDITVHPPFH